LILDAVVAERDVAGAARRGGERDAEQAGAHRIQPVGLGVESDEAGQADGVGPGEQGGFGGDGLVGAVIAVRDGSGLGRGRVVRQQQLALAGGAGGRTGGGRGGRAVEAKAGGDAAEPLGGEPCGKGLALGRPGVEVIDGHRQRRVLAQYYQLAGDAGGVGVLEQHVPPLGRLHAGSGLQHGVEGAELGYQQGGCLGADPGHAGHVVGGIAHQGLDLDQLVRGDAELLHHLGRADGLLLDRVVHADAGPDELHQILVGGHDGRLAADLDGGAGVGGDQVVSFPIRQLDGGNAEGDGGLPDQRELGNQLVGRRRAVRLVGLVDAVAKGQAAGVEDDGDMGALVVLQQLGEHVGEAENGVHWHAVRPRHRRQSVEGAEDESRAVDQHQMRRRPACFRGGWRVFRRRDGGFSVQCRGPRLRSAHRAASSTGTSPGCRRCAGKRADGRARRLRHRRELCGRRHG
jgi:hypothetical protein